MENTKIIIYQSEDGKTTIQTQTMKKFGNSEFAKKPTNYYNIEEDFIKVIENQTKRFRYEL